MIAVNDPMILILKILKTNDHVWVVENRNNPLLLGVITENDIIKGLSPPELQTYRYGRFDQKVLYHPSEDNARSLMTSTLITCTKDSKVRDILILMLQYKIRRVPIVENDLLIGEVTVKNLINNFLDIITEQDSE